MRRDGLRFELRAVAARSARSKGSVFVDLDSALLLLKETRSNLEQTALRESVLRKCRQRGAKPAARVRAKGGGND